MAISYILWVSLGSIDQTVERQNSNPSTGVFAKTLHGYTGCSVQYSWNSKHKSAAVALPSRDSQASTSAPVNRRNLEGCHEKFSAVPLSGKPRSAKM